MCGRNLNSLLSCWDHWEVTLSRCRGEHPLTKSWHALNSVSYFNFYLRDICSGICSALFNLSPPPVISRKIPNNSRLTKFILSEWQDRHIEARKHIDRYPLWIIYLPGVVGATCPESLGEGAVPGEDSAVGKREAAGSGLAPFSLHSQ